MKFNQFCVSLPPKVQSKPKEGKIVLFIFFLFLFLSYFRGVVRFAKVKIAWAENVGRKRKREEKRVKGKIGAEEESRQFPASHFIPVHVPESILNFFFKKKVERGGESK